MTGKTLYSVEYFGSHPDQGNDDCWSGRDVESLEESIKLYRSNDLPACCRTCTAYICWSGLGGDRMVRKNPHFRPDRNKDEWRREMAMQSGMENGTTGWNDYYG